MSGLPEPGRHIGNVKGFGVPVVVINHFFSDTDAEIEAAYVAEQGAEGPVQHWAGSEGIEDLAKKLRNGRGHSITSRPLPGRMPLFQKVETIAKRIYPPMR